MPQHAVIANQCTTQSPWDECAQFNRPSAGADALTDPAQDRYGHRSLRLIYQIFHGVSRGPALRRSPDSPLRFFGSPLRSRFAALRLTPPRGTGFHLGYTFFKNRSFLRCRQASDRHQLPGSRLRIHGFLQLFRDSFSPLRPVDEEEAMASLLFSASQPSGISSSPETSSIGALSANSVSSKSPSSCAT